MKEMDRVRGNIEIEKIAQKAIKSVVEQDNNSHVFDELLLDEEIRDELKSRFSDTTKSEEIASRLKEVDKNKQTELLLSSIGELRKKRNSALIKRRIIALTSSVAAVIAIFIFVFTNYDKWGNDKIMYVATNNNGVDKPTLIFDDGNKVDLEKISDKMIEGETIIEKVNDNELRYVVDNAISKKNETAEISYNTIIVPANYTYTVILEDGSEIIINAGSKLIYPVKFDDKSRQVELEGEAFFKVAKGDIPFIVNADTVDIKVYGTEFNVNSRKNRTEVVLLSGKVGAKVGEIESIMKPEECFRYNNSDGSTILEEVIIDEYIGWVKGEFYYVNRDIETVLIDIANWYDISFSYNIKDFEDKNVNLYALRSTSIGQVIKMIELTLNTKIINEGGGEYSIDK